VPLVVIVAVGLYLVHKFAESRRRRVQEGEAASQGFSGEL
jgi:hypothetical protein